MSEAGSLCYGSGHIVAAAAAEAGHCARDCGAGQGHWPHTASDPVQCSDDPYLEPAAQECSAPRVSSALTAFAFRVVPKP